MISKLTKRNIFDQFNQENIYFYGEKGHVESLRRLYELGEMPADDPHFNNAHEEISWAVGSEVYKGNWVFEDPRFELLDGSDDVFLHFICNMAHPLVRSDAEEAKRVLEIANDWLQEDGLELYPKEKRAGGYVLSFREVKAKQRPKEDEVAHIWKPDRLRIFISHRDAHKADVKGFSESLERYDFCTFVAHDSIEPMSTWMHEIMKGLQTMDVFVCYITNDFYKSVWTNQEVGFALSKNVPIYLFSVDGSVPEGFSQSKQAIKNDFPRLLKCIEKDCKNNSNYKKQIKKRIVNNFCMAKKGTFSWAKAKFYDLVGLQLDDKDIEAIVNAISAETRGINQLGVILGDEILPEHASHPKLQGYTHYRQYLENDILKAHTSQRYVLKDDVICIQDEEEKREQ